MRAKAQLEVTDEMSLTIQLEMTVGEAKALLRATSNVEQWPMHSFREVFRQSLTKAEQAYFSEHEVSP